MKLHNEANLLFLVSDISHKIIIRLQKYKVYFGLLDIIGPYSSFCESKLIPSVMSELHISSV